jgi:hypothetical protein
MRRCECELVGTVTTFCDLLNVHVDRCRIRRGRFGRRGFGLFGFLLGGFRRLLRRLSFVVGGGGRIHSRTGVLRGGGSGAGGARNRALYVGARDEVFGPVVCFLLDVVAAREELAVFCFLLDVAAEREELVAACFLLDVVGLLDAGEV